MDTRLPSERPGGFGRKKFRPRANINHQEGRHEEVFAYDLKAFGGCGAPVVISEGLNAGSGIWTVFVRKLNGTGLRHVVGSPEGTLIVCRDWVWQRIRSGRYAAWTAEAQSRARAPAR